MKGWLPFPLVFLALLAMWLLLNQTFAPGHLLLGGAIACCGTLALGRLETPRRRKLGVVSVAQLLALVLVDLVRSNIAVAGIVLYPRRGDRRAGFLEIPLELRDPGGLAVLACIVTATPGTSWARYERGRDVLTIHVLDLRDEEAWIRDFKQRYERRLVEMFQ
jgi:multicomponent K+:H+ antiporter subunit E